MSTGTRLVAVAICSAVPVLRAHCGWAPSFAARPVRSCWLADLLAFGEQVRAVFRRHRWLAGLAMTRPVIGPNGTGLIEHFLSALQGHPAPVAAKMEAFGMLNGITAAFARYEQADPGSGPALAPARAALVR